MANRMANDGPIERLRRSYVTAALLVFNSLLLLIVALAIRERTDCSSAFPTPRS